jgi:hypothetical protein
MKFHIFLFLTLNIIILSIIHILILLFRHDSRRDIHRLQFLKEQLA